ncbi:PPE domain-containing protein [Actinokineospora iranica]|uniref:PPE family protein n=1 Tax=Actinokineospora iranica TaxID=1271860 RepID=A0A1G6Q722_9PSEU|nr:PPE domain-containing protein [Actinokineospora iranica]SDC88272.1 PPE family protein [Actinokineospora iranica]
MAGDSGLADLRFEGYSMGALADQLDKLRQGPGSESLFQAVQALTQIADGLAETDRVLREQLAAIGVSWEGTAGEGGQEATKNSSIYAADAVPTVEQSADGVNEQGDTFSSTRNGAPDGKQLRGPTELNGFDRFAGALGHTTDNAQQVRQTQQAHQQAVAAMNGYSQGSQAALGSYQSLPVPPGLNLVATPVPTTGTTSVQGFSSGGGSFRPSGAPGPGGGGGYAPPPGGGGSGDFSGVNPNNPGNPGGPGGNPGGSGGSGGPGGGGNSTPNLPGRSSGVGPITPGLPGMPGGGNNFAGLRPGFSGALMGDIAAAAGIAGAGGAGAAAGASAEKDRLIRGAKNAEAAEGRAARGLNAAADVPEEQARAARNAERLAGGKAGRPAASLMQPAAAGAGAPGEDDEEHVRKYGIDSDDVFGDDRLVVSPVLGEDD